MAAEGIEWALEYRCLEIFEEYLEEIPSNICHVSALQKINLLMTGLEKIPNEIWSLPDLQILEIEDNDLAEGLIDSCFQEISKSTSIQKLTFRCNEWVDLCLSDEDLAKYTAQLQISSVSKEINESDQSCYAISITFEHKT